MGCSASATGPDRSSERRDRATRRCFGRREVDRSRLRRPRLEATGTLGARPQSTSLQEMYTELPVQLRCHGSGKNLIIIQAVFKGSTGLNKK